VTVHARVESGCLVPREHDGADRRHESDPKEDDGQSLAHMPQRHLS
jgi:hypothetical protein